MRAEEICTHYGEDPARFHGAVNTPIFQTSLFVDCEGNEGGLEGRYAYTRVSNPTTEVVEQKVAALEQGEAAKCFSSGMGAISAAMMHYIKEDSHVVATASIYGPARRFLSEYMKRFGIKVTFVSGTDPEELEAAVCEQTDLIYLESPSTYLFLVQNLERIAEIAKKHHAATVIDNTYATPIFQKPLTMGIDMVVHSAESLTLDQFDISCPQNETTLGEVRTSDNRIYRVYMQRGSIPKGNNTYTILITLKDGTQLKGSCYLDLQAPRVDARNIEWVDEDTIKVTVNSDEAGSLYYAIQDQVDGEGTIAPKDPAQIYAQGTKVSIGYGLNYITVKGAKAGQWFCYASEDERNNRESFYSYKQIPEYTAPAPDDTEKPMITGVEVLKASDGATLKVVFNQDVEGYYDNNLTQISGIAGKLLFEAKYSSEGDFESNVLTLTVKDRAVTIPKGSHTLTIIFYDYEAILTYDFTVQ